MGKGNKPQKDDKAKMKPKSGKKLGVTKKPAFGFDKDRDGM